MRLNTFFDKPGKSGGSELFADLGANLSQIGFCFYSRLAFHSPVKNFCW